MLDFGIQMKISRKLENVGVCGKRIDNDSLSRKDMRQSGQTSTFDRPQTNELFEQSTSVLGIPTNLLENDYYSEDSIEEKSLIISSSYTGNNLSGLVILPTYEQFVELSKEGVTKVFQLIFSSNNTVPPKMNRCELDTSDEMIVQVCCKGM